LKNPGSMNYLSNALNKSVYIVIILFVLMTHSSVIAQDDLADYLIDILKQGYSEPYLQGYMQPFATAFGTIVSSGLYHRASLKSFPHMDIGVNAVLLNIPDKAKYFYFNGEQQPTFFGPEIAGSAGIPGSGLKQLTVPQIQVNMGLFSSFEFLLRGSIYYIDKIGNMDFIGVGIKYGLSDLIPMQTSPIDMSVQVIYHTYGLDGWLNSGTFAMNLHASTNISQSPLNFYGGVGYESTSLKISTDDIPGIGESGIGDVSINGKDRMRMTIGASLTLLYFNIHTDYNFGYYKSIAFGAMVVF